MRKKALILAVSIYVLGSLIACSKSIAETKEPEITGGVLVMATNAEFPPYEYYEDGKIVGIDVDIAYAIAKKLGMTLQIEDMDFESIIPEVRLGNADVGIAGITLSADRLKKVDFTNSYVTVTQVILVNEDSEIQSSDDLKGKNIGVLLGTMGDIYASDYEADGSVMKRYSKGSEAVQDLIQGNIHTFVIDQELGKKFVAGQKGIKMLDGALTVEYYAIAVQKGNAELIEKINAALEELEHSGELQKIIDKYISTN